MYFSDQSILDSVIKTLEINTLNRIIMLFYKRIFPNIRSSEFSIWYPKQFKKPMLNNVRSFTMSKFVSSRYPFNEITLTNQLLSERNLVF